MSKITLQVTNATLVQCGENLYALFQSEDGQLYIEAETSETLKVTVSDDGDCPVVAQGTWINVTVDNQEEESNA